MDKAMAVEQPKRSSSKTAAIVLALIILGCAVFLFLPFLSDVPGISVIFFILPCLAALGGLLFVYRKYTQGKQIELRLDKRTFSLGEPLTGSVILNLGKDTPARGLSVKFYGVYYDGNYHNKICTTRLDLAGSRTYKKGESFPFSIPIPGSARQSLGASQLSWHVEAQLDISKEVDMVKTERVKLQ